MVRERRLKREIKEEINRRFEEARRGPGGPSEGLPIHEYVRRSLEVFTNVAADILAESLSEYDTERKRHQRLRQVDSGPQNHDDGTE